MLSSRFYILILSLLFCTCLEEEGVSPAFPIVSTGAVTHISADGVTFSASIKNASLGQISHHGFVWSKEESFTNSIQVTLGKPRQNNFNYRAQSGLDPGKYFCRGYVRTATKTVYGTVVEFTNVGCKGPEVTSFEPASASAGDLITIHGKYFTSSAPIAQVIIGNKFGSIVSFSDTLITATLPGLTRAKNAVGVSVLDKKAYAVDSLNLLVPELTGFASKKFSICDTIVIEGINLTALKTPVVQFNNIAAMVHSVTATQIRCTATALISGPITVKVSGDQFNLTARDKLTMNIPSITSISIDDYSPGDSVVIHHEYLDQCENLVVTLSSISGGLSRQIEEFKSSANQIRFRLPDNGCFNDDLKVRLGTSAFEVVTTEIQYRPPVIESITPTQGKVGDEVTITGRNLLTLNANTEPVNIMNVTYASSTEYRGTIKAIASETEVVDVVVTSCTDWIVSPFQFTYDAPEIFSITPSEIHQLSDSVTITGRNLSPIFNYIHNDYTVDPVWVQSNGSGEKIAITAGELFRNFSWLADEVFTGTLTLTTAQNASISFPLNISYDGPLEEVASISRYGYPAIATALNGKGYTGLGMTDGYYPTNEWWAFDPQLDQWEQKADFPGLSNWSRSVAALDNQIFVGGSYDTFDWWSYDPEQDAWIQKTDYPGASQNRFAIVADNMIYSGGPVYETERESFTELYRYDPALDSWTQMPSLPTLPQPEKLIYAHGGNVVAYNLASGQKHEFSSATNEWTTKAITPMTLWNASTLLQFDNFIMFSDGLGGQFYKINFDSDIIESLEREPLNAMDIQEPAFTIGNNAYLLFANPQLKVYRFDPLTF